MQEFLNFLVCLYFAGHLADWIVWNTKNLALGGAYFLLGIKTPHLNDIERMLLTMYQQTKFQNCNLHEVDVLKSEVVNSFPVALKYKESNIQFHC